jgi:hypothetical protein
VPRLEVGGVHRLGFGGDPARRVPGPPLVAAPKRVLTPRTAAWAALRRPERRGAEDRALLAGLREHSRALDEAVGLAEEFAALVRGREPERLDPWLQRAQDGAAGLEQRPGRGPDQPAQDRQAPDVWPRRPRPARTPLPARRMITKTCQEPVLWRRS